MGLEGGFQDERELDKVRRVEVPIKKIFLSDSTKQNSQTCHIYFVNLVMNGHPQTRMHQG